MPAPASTPIAVGDVLYFQVWFRDFNPGPTSNLTNGLGIAFL